MTKKISFFITITILFACCGNRFSSTRLDEIDSLVMKELYDSAYHEVLRTEMPYITDEEDKAHYCLLLTKTSYLSRNPAPPDSVINQPIAYYKEHDNKEKLFDAYYYKAEYLLKDGDYTQAIILYKKAEETARQSKNMKQRFKVAESLSYINCLCGEYDLQLQYVKDALNIALELGSRNWIAYSYNYMNEAYMMQGKTDSAVVYADKTVPYLKYVYEKDLPYILNSIGYTYMWVDMKKARKYIEKSLSLKPLTRTMENLAFIYRKEGNEQKAYELWQKAFLLDDVTPKDIILYNILQYDIAHNDMNGASERLYKMVSIKDSLNNVLKDRTVQKLQDEYDEKVAESKAENTRLLWITAVLVLTVIIISLTGYINYKKYKARIMFANHQFIINTYISRIRKLEESETKNSMQIETLNGIINDYEEQIRKLEVSGNNADEEITELKRKIKENIDHISYLETTCTDAKEQITELNGKIKELMEQEAPRLIKGKILYDNIRQNKTVSDWSNKEFKCFVDYYKAIDYDSFIHIEKKYSPKTIHNMFFLILYDMGKEDKDIRQIMGITQEAIRSTRFRIQKNAKRR
ncbi:MAG: hypothetical protein Q4D41_06885 [Prevotellaceae bacterium]|nr:hypothetical protein [Prevotellaceae bacterium]